MSEKPPPQSHIQLNQEGLAEARLMQFRVRLGHAQVVVRGATPDDAVREARRELCLQLPRMWDVIQAMEDDRFQVSPLDAPQPPK